MQRVSDYFDQIFTIYLSGGIMRSVIKITLYENINS